MDRNRNPYGFFYHSSSRDTLNNEITVQHQCCQAVFFGLFFRWLIPTEMTMKSLYFII